MVELAVIYFQLPDERVVLQRRDATARTAAGQLGFFGGHVEPGETPDQAVRREVVEETSLNIDDLEIEFVHDTYLKADEGYPKDRHTFLYKATLDDMNFEVFEGDRAEAYTIKEALDRKDITVGVRINLERAETSK